jgi:metal-responsive CopG/Arc/MetJ family transcriptional regulator
VKATVVRLPHGMDTRIDAVLEVGEKRADLIRMAVEKELKRRERKSSS